MGSMRRARAALAVALAGVLPLVLHAQTAVLIHGRVVSADTGDPLVHARVVVFNDATPLPAIFSDNRGQFSSAPLPPGRYRLSVTKAGYAQTSAARLDTVAPDGVTVRMPRSGAIAGRVLDRFGEPAAGVQMQLFTQGADRTKLGAVRKRTTTDDLGEYRFGGLEEGTYVVGATTQQFDRVDVDPRRTLYYPGVALVGDAQNIDLDPGDEKLGVDFAGINTQPGGESSQVSLAGAARFVGPNGQVLTPSMLAGTGIIRGRITRPDGLPIAHATVSTSVSGTLNLGGTVALNVTKSIQTDEDGAYELAMLPAGRYNVSASKVGYSLARYGQRNDGDPVSPVDVAEGQTRTRIDIVLPRNSNVMGRVVDEFGDPVENASVALALIRFQGGRRRLVNVSAMSGRTTDDLGRYRIYAVPPGEYVVTASVGQVVPFEPDRGVSGYAITYFPSTTAPREAQLVAVSKSQDVTAVDFVLVPTPTATVAGKKVGFDGRPFGGSLWLSPSQRSGAIATPGSGARIYDDGRFEFPNVAAGDYVIQAQEGQSGPGREGQFASAFVTVNGDDVPDVLLQSAPGSTISGRVIFEGDGPTVQALSVTTSRADFDRTPNSTASADVGSDLRFAMTGIRGPRRLTLARAPSGWMLKSVIAKGVDVTDVALPFGEPDQSLSDVDIVLTSQVTELSGTVVDARGDAANTYTLLVFPVDRDRWYPGSRYFRRAAPGSAGNFSVRGLPPSDYFVAPMSGWDVLKGGDDAWQDPEFLESMTLRATRATLGEGGRLSISAKLITP
jgi:Carboxypeptidase regulatory-like domain